MTAPGQYIAIDLDENNRHALEARREQFPGVSFPALGWGVCRHGHGLQDLPPLSERQARELAAKLNAAPALLVNEQIVELTTGMYRALCGLVHPSDAIDPAEVTAPQADWDALRVLFPLSDAHTIHNEEGHA